MDYLALRRHDIRHLQSELAALGLSSLGRTEPHVLSSLHAVFSILLKLAGAVPISLPQRRCPSLDWKIISLTGTPKLCSVKPNRPSRSNHGYHATGSRDKYELVRDLLAQGMDCIRINCAHDSPEAWSGMIRTFAGPKRRRKNAARLRWTWPDPNCGQGQSSRDPRS